MQAIGENTDEYDNDNFEVQEVEQMTTKRGTPELIHISPAVRAQF